MNAIPVATATPVQPVPVASPVQMPFVTPAPVHTPQPVAMPNAPQPVRQMPVPAPQAMPQPSPFAVPPHQPQPPQPTGADPALVTMICEMGFDRPLVERALAQAGGNGDMAVNLLLSGVVDQGQPGPAQGMPMQQAPMQGGADDGAMATLMAITGRNEQECRYVLQRVQGNVEAAANLLLDASSMEAQGFGQMDQAQHGMVNSTAGQPAQGGWGAPVAPAASAAAAWGAPAAADAAWGAAPAAADAQAGWGAAYAPAQAPVPGPNDQVDEETSDSESF
ncbi:hypothetical protein KIPB_005180 [Kipferlia bialata]|uniref:UBA domain-containing protein n=1 Tax=Kipferlia bialata TaxID=797122 RepID=A0A9K3CV74_9EUKA|nr:hypothetical protein KIPB_005180 [Kipferlia bialata]|eukprot:g5180.t1